MKYFVVLLLGFVLYGCKKNEGDTSNKTYRFDETIVIDGITRTYTVVLPSDYYDSNSFSLVIALHGGGGSSSQFEKSSGLSEKANKSGFIVVYPDGTGVIQTWNAGLCWGYAMNNDIDDVKFISMLIDKLLKDYKINPKKVYATGHSNGGMMCYRLACELGNKIAAIAPNSCTMVTTSCNPARSMPILHMHSKLDEHVPYLGGTGNGITGIYCPPVEDVLNYWAGIDECTTGEHSTFSNSSYSIYQWTGCNASRIDFYLTNDGGHGWPGGLPGGPNSDTPSQSINANDLLWSFFQQYQLP
jgi:polyhydroxybutyrate depolymerase